MTLTIGEMAKQVNIAPSTLRYYDKEGLLPCLERSNGNIRLFSENDLERLNLIECLKQTGMSIKDIKTFMDWCMEGDSTIDKRLELIAHQRQTMLDQIEEMKKNLKLLDYKRWYYETAKAAGTCSIFDQMSEDEIQEKFRASIYYRP